MNRTAMLLCLPALLAVLLTAPPACAADPELEKSDAKKILEKLQQLQEDNLRLRQDIARDREELGRQLRTRDETIEQRLRILENKVEDLERAAKGRISGSYNPDALTPSPDQLRDLDARIRRLEQKERQSGSFTPGDTINPPPTTGVIRIQNLSMNTSLMRVNGVTYTIRPGETVNTTVAAGTFTYEVLADGRGFAWAPQVRTVRPNEMYTLTVNP